MYMTVLESSLARELNPEEMGWVRERFQQVMGTIVVLFDELSLANLAMLLDQSKEMIASQLGSLHSLLDIGMLEEEDRPIRLLHPTSFREFLVDPQRCSNTTFRIDAKEAHRHLFECCLRVMSSCLRQDMCHLRQPGTWVGDVLRSDVNKNIPFAVQYACRYWVRHLEQSGINFQDHHGIAKFFEARFLSWLETLALIGRLADGIGILQFLEATLPVGELDAYSISQLTRGRRALRLVSEAFGAG
jgi:hypothetical protein